MWHKAIGEENGAQIKEKSLLGHLLCSEVLPKRFLGSSNKGVTKISTLYKISSSKFNLIFESERAIAVLEKKRSFSVSRNSDLVLLDRERSLFL